MGPKELIAIAGTALLHFLYFMSLQRGYAKGDLSLVYPCQRHSPLLTTLGAIFWLGERPSSLRQAAVLIIICVFLITLSARPRLNPTNNEVKQSRYRLWTLTGTLIASYTLGIKLP
ncbi:MAG: hypothetical protein R2865_08505 [Deinococcales bacterium]